MLHKLVWLPEYEWNKLKVFGFFFHITDKFYFYFTISSRVTVLANALVTLIGIDACTKICARKGTAPVSFLITVLTIITSVASALITAQPALTCSINARVGSAVIDGLLAKLTSKPRLARTLVTALLCNALCIILTAISWRTVIGGRTEIYKYQGMNLKTDLFSAIKLHTSISKIICIALALRCNSNKSTRGMYVTRVRYTSDIQITIASASPTTVTGHPLCTISN